MGLLDWMGFSHRPRRTLNPAIPSRVLHHWALKRSEARGDERSERAPSEAPLQGQPQTKTGLHKLQDALRGLPARPNRFEVVITLPPILFTGTQGDQRGHRGFFVINDIHVFTSRTGFVWTLPDAERNKIQHAPRQLSITCEAATLPGRGLATKEMRTYGPVRKTPTGDQSYAEMAMSFIVSHEMQEKKFFEAWQQSVFNPISHDMNYYNEYVTTIDIFQLSPRADSRQYDIAYKDWFQQHDYPSERIYGVRLFEAYPSIIGDLGLSYGEMDSYHKLPITMVYRKWLELDVQSLNPKSLDDYAFSQIKGPNIPMSDWDG